MTPDLIGALFVLFPTVVAVVARLVVAAVDLAPET